MALGLTTETVRCIVLAATSSHPEVNSTISALVMASNNGAVAAGARAKKYSTESVKPLKLPKGSTRPVANWLKTPGGTVLPSD